MMNQTDSQEGLNLRSVPWRALLDRRGFGKVLWTLLFLAFIQVGHAEDVAMVTQIEGAGIEARIEASSWKPSLGEVLPASVAIAIEAGSTRGILHLLANAESTIPGPKAFTIQKEGFVGIEAGEIKRVEGFAARLDLASQSLQVVGAVSADKVSYGSGESAPPVPAAPAAVAVAPAPVAAAPVPQAVPEKSFEYAKKSTFDFSADKERAALKDLLEKSRAQAAGSSNVQRAKKRKIPEMDPPDGSETPLIPFLTGRRSRSS